MRFAPLAQVVPDQKAQTARHDQEHDDALHIPVGGVAHQAHIALSAAQNIKSCIAESRDGQKNRDENALSTVFRNKDRQQQHKAQTLEEGGKLHDYQKQAAGLRHIGGADGFAGQLHGAEADPAAERQREEAGQCDKAQAADLDQADHDCLAEQGEALVGVQHHQTGHTGGACGREKGLHRSDAVAGGKWQHEQQCAGHDHHKKAGNDQPCRGETLQSAAFFRGRSGPADQPAQLRCLKGTVILFHGRFPPCIHPAPLSRRTNAILLYSYNIHVCKRYFNLILHALTDIILQYVLSGPNTSHRLIRNAAQNPMPP